LNIFKLTYLMEEVVYSLPEYRLVDDHKAEGTTYWIVGAESCKVPEPLRATFEK
jgi:hypothetical protein